jgi:hypothetical protein
MRHKDIIAKELSGKAINADKKVRTCIYPVNEVAR